MKVTLTDVIALIERLEIESPQTKRKFTPKERYVIYKARDIYLDCENYPRFVIDTTNPRTWPRKGVTDNEDNAATISDVLSDLRKLRSEMIANALVGANA